jgi:hypothetical protein
VPNDERGLFLFRFGNGDYCEQDVVVRAWTLEQAHELLVADLTRRGLVKRRVIPNENLPLGEPWSFYHNLESLTAAEESDLGGVAVAGDIVYTYGVDG